MKKIKISLIIIFLVQTIIIIFASETFAKEAQKNEQNILYEAHVEKIGWQDWKENGKTAGTTGECKRLEAIKIKTENMPNTVKIKYQAHVEKIGWQDWKKSGEIAGTTGQCLRLEAIKIQLDETEEYSVMYRAHVEKIGWQEWKYDGEIAGTTGQCLRLEAIEIKIVPKKEKANINIDTGKDGSKYYKNDDIIISGWKIANISNTKIEAYLDDKKIDEKQIQYKKRPDVIKQIEIGTEEQNPTPGFSFKIIKENLSDGKHTIKINVVNSLGKVIESQKTNINYDTQIHIMYQAHVEKIGWQNWKEDGEIAGTTGQYLRAEAIKIKLVNAPEGAKIKYRAHVEKIGWQNWKYDGEIAGTTGQCLRLEAIKIELENMPEYSVKYKLHVEKIGWQDTANDGETAGTEGKCLRAEAIEIKVDKSKKEDKIKICIDNPQEIVEAEKAKISGWVMTNIKNTKIRVLLDDKLQNDNIIRIERPDVLEEIKGYGGEKNNPQPGFETTIDLSGFANTKKRIKVQVIDEKEKVIKEELVDISINKKIQYGSGVYGQSGLKVAGKGGSDLKYLKYGSGKNVMFATFAIHGYEDKWDKDGYELVEIANKFYNRLISDKNYELAEKWTIYIFPGVNQDGLTNGWTNNGPGRTTLYSQAPGNKGIDLNRCWQEGEEYQKRTDSRNYNGTEPFQAYEAQALRKFLLENKSKDGQTVLIDLHGWTQQVIGDTEICSIYKEKFPENVPSYGRYGTGYLIDWARKHLGSSGKVARSALIELPKVGVDNHQSVIDKDFANKYITSTLKVLKNIN